jgi:ABC-type Fe3+/spermidine/putrescine transport system ATPase subunit
MVTPAGLFLDHVRFRIGAFEMPDFSLSVSAGEYVAVTGANGSGKTVLLKLIAGLYAPESGRIVIGGRDVTALPPWERAVGAIQQEGLLFPNRTVRGNVEFGLEMRRLPPAERRAAAEEMAGQLGLTALLDRRPEGLSGGERQRVSLARALVLKPPLLLLDEPVSAIDESSRDALLLRELRPLQRRLGITVLHVAHNRQEMRLVADRVVTLSAGRLADDRPAEGAA